MQGQTLEDKQMSQDTISDNNSPKKESIKPVKGIAIILVFTILFVVIGMFLGKTFFWNNYNKETKIEHELSMNIENVKNDPENSNNHLNLGWTYLKMGENEKAVGELKKALSLEPKNYGANLNLGIAYIKLGNYDRAISALKDAISISPKTNQAHLNLGLAYYYVDKLDDALNELELAYKYNPGIPDSKYVRGMVYEKQNKLQAALDEYSTVLSFNPEDKDIQAAVDRVKKALGK